MENSSIGHHPLKISGLMSEYIEFVADRLLVQLGFEKLYNTANPFEFMNATLLDGKTNFFEKRVSEYQHSSVSTAKNQDDWAIEDDFNF